MRPRIARKIAGTAEQKKAMSLRSLATAIYLAKLAGKELTKEEVAYLAAQHVEIEREVF